MKTSELKKLIELFNTNKGNQDQLHTVIYISRFSNSPKELVAIAKYGCTTLHLFLVFREKLPPVVYRALLKYAKDTFVLSAIKGKVPKLAYLKAELSLR